MKKIILVIILFFSLVSFGQVYKVEYFDSLNVKAKKDVNFKKVTYEKVGKNFKISTYVKGILSDASIYSDSLKWKNILRNIEYYKNGNVSKIQNYKDFNILQKETTDFYENGKKKSVFSFKAYKNNQYILVVKSYWNSKGLQKVADGNGVYEIIIDPETIITGNIKEGKQEGVWKSNTSKFPYIVEEYSNGVFISGTRCFSENDSVVYKELEVMASPKERLLNIGNEIQYKGNKSEGVIEIEFFVDENGKIKNASIIKGVNSEFDASFLKAFNKSPDWNPSVSRGKKITQKMRRPFMFKFNIEE
jgi:TonB family protein